MGKLCGGNRWKASGMLQLEKSLAWGSWGQANKKEGHPSGCTEERICLSLVSPELETGANVREVGRS